MPKLLDLTFESHVLFLFLVGNCLSKYLCRCHNQIRQLAHFYVSHLPWGVHIYNKVMIQLYGYLQDLFAPQIQIHQMNLVDYC